MNFQPDLAAKVMRGDKTVTRRLVRDNPRSPWWRERCGLVVGRDYAVCPGRGRRQLGRVVVTRVDRRPLGSLTDAEARREGFGDAAAFALAWVWINGEYDAHSLVWRVEFRPV